MRSLTGPLLFSVTLTAACQAPTPPSILPRPVSMRATGGSFPLDCFSVDARGTAGEMGKRLMVELDTIVHGSPAPECKHPLPIALSLVHADTITPDGWYDLVIAPDHIDLRAVTEDGLYNGTRTLVQLFEQGKATGSVPCLAITDFPRFTWRGMHLDVCRHFFPVPVVERYIDLLARYKMNTFHWHLTDDQGWRIEIKKYPKLTDVGAWRNGSEYGPYADRTFDSTRYGGFYTQQQIREVVAYATARHITVVPEIEMPGHSSAALAAYPELGCTGGPYEVARGWGVFPDVFCTRDETFTFLEDVLGEVIGLFPSTYIHVGGDECPHERWETCPHCQAVMKREGLKNTDELQSYFIRRIEHFLNGKGRKLIGWDEILAGGIAPNATIMSWQGTEGGIAAARAGHDAVMCPGESCYFDHYQGDPASEPLAIGGFTPLQQVYAYEPVPEGLSAEEARHIIGAQGNLWTEYITTPQQLEYMAMPRMAALAEVLWSPRAARNEQDFIARLEREMPRLDALGVHYSKSLYNVAVKLGGSKKRGQVNIDLSTGGCAGEIRYTLDGTEPTAASPQFVSTIEQRGSATLSTALFRGEHKQGNTIARTFTFNKATGRRITVDPPPNERYATGGAFTLVDGISGGDRRVSTEWLGWLRDITITVDLGGTQPLDTLGIDAWHETYAWIHAPRSVTISVSDDNVTFTPVATVSASANTTGHVRYRTVAHASARYVRFAVKTAGTIPEGLPGAGHAAWTFLDEITIR